MSDHLKIVINREELYERIWQTPAKQLAKEYRVSDTRLAVICKKLRVPKPSPGYWMKIKHGKKARRPPLPSLGPGEQAEFVHIVDEDRKRPVVIDPAIQILLDKVPAIKVPQRLNDPDPLIKNARAWLRRRPYIYSEPNRLPHISLNVYPNSMGRALRLMDALVKGLRKLGYDVRGEDASNKDQYFEILGQRIRFQFKEKAKQIEHVLTKEEMARKEQGKPVFTNKYDFLSTGHFELNLDPEIWGAVGYKKKWSDSSRRPLEGQLSDIILGVISLAGEIRKEAISQKKAEQVAAEQRIKRIEEERRQAEEEARFRELDNLVTRWTTGMQLRAYVQEYTRRFMEGSYSDEASQDFNRWLLWANEYANRLDPINASLARISDMSKKDR
ncbi:MAG: hypothetical protein IMZ57_06055 [Acidobacteria bacterium]|nr:hypothetical protein [Acidobacteriota bacterium]